MPLLHFRLSLKNTEHARLFLARHRAHVICYRFDPCGEGALLVGFDEDDRAKRVAFEEFGIEVPEGLFGRFVLPSPPKSYK